MSRRLMVILTWLITLVAFNYAFADQKMIELIFSRDVADRNPVDPFEPVATCEEGAEPSGPLPTVDSATVGEVFFWNRIVSSEATDLRHTWSKDGIKVAEVDLQVGPSSGFRTWSSKKIVPKRHAGKWTVVVSRTGDPETVLCAAHFIVE